MREVRGSAYKEELKTNPKKVVVPPRGNRRLLTGPTVFRYEPAPPPTGIICLVQDPKGRNTVSFSTVPLGRKRTRGPNKPRPDPDLAFSDEEEVDATSRGRKASRARLNKESKNPRENSEPTNASSIGKLRSTLKNEDNRQDDEEQSCTRRPSQISAKRVNKVTRREKTRRKRISKALLKKRGPTAKKPLTPAERKRRQREMQSEMKKENELMKNRWRNQLQRDQKKDEEHVVELRCPLISTHSSGSASGPS